MLRFRAIRGYLFSHRALCLYSRAARKVAVIAIQGSEREETGNVFERSRRIHRFSQLLATIGNKLCLSLARAHPRVRIRELNSVGRARLYFDIYSQTVSK